MLRDGQAIGSGMVAADGSVTGSFTSGELEAGVAERSFDLAVTDGTNQAATRFRVSRFRAEFEPSRGNPATLRVRFSVFGFGRPGLPIYLHYLRPGGALVQTLRLGMTRGLLHTRDARATLFSERSGRREPYSSYERAFSKIHPRHFSNSGINLRQLFMAPATLA